MLTGFHAIGTALLIALLLLWWMPAEEEEYLRSLGRCSHVALPLPLLSVAVWLWWAATGFATSVSVVFAGGVFGCLVAW